MAATAIVIRDKDNNIINQLHPNDFCDIFQFLDTTVRNITGVTSNLDYGVFYDTAILDLTNVHAQKVWAICCGRFYRDKIKTAVQDIVHVNYERICNQLIAAVPARKHVDKSLPNDFVVTEEDDKNILPINMDTLASRTYSQNFSALLKAQLEYIKKETSLTVEQTIDTIVTDSFIECLRQYIELNWEHVFNMTESFMDLQDAPITLSQEYEKFNDENQELVSYLVELYREAGLL